jgi:hypothetical protein
MNATSLAFTVYWIGADLKDLTAEDAFVPYL